MKVVIIMGSSDEPHAKKITSGTVLNGSNMLLQPTKTQVLKI